MTDTATIPFDHINLNEVDPEAKKPDNGVPLQFQITGAEMKPVKTDKFDGTVIDMVFTVVNNDSYTGRRYYTRLFPDKEGGKNPTARRLRILSDATGISQSGEFESFLTDLVAQKATFTAPLQTDARSTNGKQEINLWQAAPAN